MLRGRRAEQARRRRTHWSTTIRESAAWAMQPRAMHIYRVVYPTPCFAHPPDNSSLPLPPAHCRPILPFSFFSLFPSLLLLTVPVAQGHLSCHSLGHRPVRSFRLFLVSSGSFPLFTFTLGNVPTMSTNRDKTTARMQATPSRRVTRGAAARGEQANADHDATPAVEGPGGSPDAMDRSPDGAGSMGSSHSDPSFVAPQGTTPITPSARQTRSGSAPQQGEPNRGVPDATPGQDQEPKTPSVPEGGVSDPVSNNEGANAPSGSGSAPRESVSGAGEAANSLAGLPALQDFVSQLTPVASSPPLLEYDHLSPAWQGVTGPLDEIPASFFESTEGNSPRMDVQLVGEVSRGAASSGSEAEWRGQARARYTRINRGRVPYPPASSATAPSCCTLATPITSMRCRRTSSRKGKRPLRSSPVL